jgi:hypothetical protein
MPTVSLLEGGHRERNSADEGDWPAERFEANRSHLRAVAYRMLGLEEGSAS